MSRQTRNTLLITLLFSTGVLPGEEHVVAGGGHADVELAVDVVRPHAFRPVDAPVVHRLRLRLRGRSDASGAASYLPVSGVGGDRSCSRPVVCDMSTTQHRLGA